ncbi:fungal-specific transcription factor domain-containing protein [Lipomyces doorenjongii]
MVGEHPVRHRTRIRKPRGRGLRTTTGCTKCRVRHLKCDEAKPVCGQCMKIQETCIYTGAAAAGATTYTNTSTVAETAVLPLVHQLSEGQQSAQCVEPRERSQSPIPLHENANQNSMVSGDEHGPGPGHTTDAFLREWAAVSPSNSHRSVVSSNYLSPQSVSDLSHSVIASSVTSSGHTADTAAVRWFGLLASDAARDSIRTSAADASYGQELNIFDSHDKDPTRITPIQQATYLVDNYRFENGDAHDGSSYALPKDGPEERLWQAPENLELLPQEHFLFENFVQRISQWIDLFDTTNKFSTFVPHLAMRNAGLMNAVLALSCRHLSLNRKGENEEPPDRNSALQYYYQTLHYVQRAMQYDSYKTSLELLATTLIVSTYEMLDGSCHDWERHLEGVFWIQRSQLIHGESGGLKSAVWWAWLCQDVWVAFREKRKTFTFWTPTKSYADLSPDELAARSVYLAAKVINYCSREECEADKYDLQTRIEQANQLQDRLDEWQNHLTVEFSPLPSGNRASSSVFKAIWIRPPAFGVAIQLNCASRVLLALHRPCIGGMNSYLNQQANIKHCVETICGIAMRLTDDASSLMSAQCLYIAGLCVQESQGREAVLELLDSCRQRTGWPTTPLENELKSLWKKMADKS